MRRRLILAAALPLALGCAQQSASHRASLPPDGSLQVQLFPPSADRMSIDYVLSEPAYVAIFAVSPGQGITLVYPHSLNQIDQPRRRGINQVWPHRTSGRAYYIIASRYPLPVGGILRSKSLLRQLVGEEAFRAAKLPETWEALNAAMVAGLPEQTWASSTSTYRAVASSRVYDHLAAGRQAFFSQLFSGNGNR